jgi:hypothetical protein
MMITVPGLVSIETELYLPGGIFLRKTFHGRIPGHVWDASLSSYNIMTFQEYPRQTSDGGAHRGALGLFLLLLGADWGFLLGNSASDWGFLLGNSSCWGFLGGTFAAAWGAAAWGAAAWGAAAAAWGAAVTDWEGLWNITRLNEHGLIRAAAVVFNVHGIKYHQCGDT